MYNHKEYQNQYHTEKLKRRALSFSKDNPEDMKLWNYLETVPNITKYIKKLILDDMKKHGADK